MRSRARLATSALLVAVALSSPRARAADPNDARIAQALFEEARQLMAAQRFAEACPKLAESQRLDPAGGTLLNLALCHENEGKVATALVEYGDALALATRDGRRDRQALAREHIALIEQSVPRLTVTVPPAADADGLEVTLDGAALPRAAWGVATPIDPGAHTVSAAAPGRSPWTVTLSVLAGEKKAVEVPPPAPVAELPASPPPASPAPTLDVPPEPASGGTRANPVFYGVLGLTAVAAGTATLTGILALGASFDAKDGCLPERQFCRDAASRDAAERAETLAWVSTGALAATLVGSVALLFIPSRKVRGPEVGLAVAPGGGVLRIGGAL